MVHDLRVLVVDGEAATRDLIAGMLTEAGLEVRVTSAAQDIELALSSGDFDIVVSASDPPRAALLAQTRSQRPTPPVISVGDAPIHGLLLLSAIRDLTSDD